MSNFICITWAFTFFWFDHPGGTPKTCWKNNNKFLKSLYIFPSYKILFYKLWTTLVFLANPNNKYKWNIWPARLQPSQWPHLEPHGLGQHDFQPAQLTMVGCQDDHTQDLGKEECPTCTFIQDILSYCACKAIGGVMQIKGTLWYQLSFVSHWLKMPFFSCLKTYKFYKIKPDQALYLGLKTFPYFNKNM